jgi:hypothetical protein
VEDLRDRGFASDGLESNDKGRLYQADYEHNGVLRPGTGGQHETLVYDPRVLWPDSLSLANDGYHYFTANQMHRHEMFHNGNHEMFHNGNDLREKPYALFRVKVDAGPVRLPWSK